MTGRINQSARLLIGSPRRRSRQEGARRIIEQSDRTIIPTDQQGKQPFALFMPISRGGNKGISSPHIRGHVRPEPRWAVDKVKRINVHFFSRAKAPVLI